MSHDSHVNIIFNYHKAISTDEISTYFLPYRSTVFLPANFSHLQCV